MLDISCLASTYLPGREPTMKIDGRCHCGYISYEPMIDPEKVVVCHCTDCQTLAGSAFRTNAFSGEGSFRILTGEPKIYVRTSDSGNQRTAAFCPERGTPIFGSSIGDQPKVYVVRIATARQRNELVPKSQRLGSSAQHWIGDLGSIPKVDKQPTLS
jgi:hypothetical protein